MGERSRALIAAADSWLSAVQAMTAADEEQRGTEDQQLDLDEAEMALGAPGGMVAGADGIRG